MKCLLDTNALIGVLFHPDFLSDAAREAIDSSEDLYVSIVSLWEIGIKQSIGKIGIEADAVAIQTACHTLDIGILPLEAKHIDIMKTLPQNHKDPFDRIIIAQAIAAGMPLITSDEKIPQYDEVQTIW